MVTETDDLISASWLRAKQGASVGRVSPDPVRYQTDPVAWIVDRLGIPENTLRWSLNGGYSQHRWDGTTDPLSRVVEGLAAGKNVGVESATGTGKTFLGACTVLWFLACFEDSIVVTSAPKAEQLKLHIWKEIGRIWPRFHRHFPPAELIDLKVRLRSGAAEKEAWAAVGFACGVDAGATTAVRAQGFHAEHMLIVLEETPGIHPAIMEAFENTCTADHNLRLAFGNPDNQADALHQFCLMPGTVHVRISALDHPNVVLGRSIVPGAVSQASIDRRLARYRSVDHRLYQSRVRGISPAESAEALIRRAWCEEASNRYSDPSLRVGFRAMGVDVANSDEGDKGAISRWLGACLTEIVSFPCPDASQLGVRVYTEATADEEWPVEARYVGVDSVGVGASTINKLKELGFKAQALNGGEKAVFMIDEDVRYQLDENGQRLAGPKVVEEEKFANLRSQMWWQMRLDLERGKIALPFDSELFDDLTQPTWWTHNGKIHVESKEDIRERLGRSPDKGDAAVYGNWVRERKPTPVDNKPKDLSEARKRLAEKQKTDYKGDEVLERISKQHELTRKHNQRAMQRLFGKKGS